MRFVDASLGETNRALADAAWREHFGERAGPAGLPRFWSLLACFRKPTRRSRLHCVCSFDAADEG